MAKTKVHGEYLDPSVISGQTQVTAVGADSVLILDATDNALKKALLSDVIETVGSTPSFTSATISASDPVLNIARTSNYSYKIGSLANDTFVIQSNETTDASYASLIEIDSFAHQGGVFLKGDANGRLGIRQTSPDTTVHIGDGASHFVRIENAASGDVSSGYQIYRGASTVGAQIYDNPADNATTLLTAGLFNIITGGSGVDFTISASGTFNFKTGNLYLTGSNDRRIKLSDSGQSGIVDSNNTVHVRGDNDFLKLNAAGNGGHIFEINGVTKLDMRDNYAIFENTDGQMIVRDTTAGGGAGNGGYISLQGHHAGSGDGFREFGRIAGVKQNSTGGATQGDLRFYTNSGAVSATEKFRINAAGDLFAFNLAGSTAGNPTMKINTSSGYIYYDSSSLRYKENIQDFGSALGKIKELRPVTYDDKKLKIPSFGLIAEEVNEIAPELVTYKDIDGESLPEAVVYDRLTIHLLKAMQEQQEQIESLKKEIEELKNV